MTRRRGSKGPSSQRRGPNESSLEALGRKIDAGDTGSTEPEGAAGLANEDGLRSLGQKIDSSSPRSHRRRRRGRKRRVFVFTTLGLVVVLVGLAGASYYYLSNEIKKIEKPLCGTTAKFCAPEISGKPFNILAIGSDSRAGLTGPLAAATGAGSVGGQRSDVVKIFHVDPGAGTISVLSIPRDTVVTLLANKALFGNYNRINVNYENGPELLVKTIEANFGITINHVIQVDFGGLAGAVNALGGIWMDFPYPAYDQYSSLNVHRAGCQLLHGFMALAVARSRHFQYFQDGYWHYDGTSDFGRIDRQNQFLRALIDKAKSDVSLTALNSFLNALPKGVSIDNTFGVNELIGLGARFHSFNPDTMAAYTLPTYSGTSSALGDVLFVQQPAAQQLLVKIFGQVGTVGGLTHATRPPPNSSFTPQPPPVVVLAKAPAHPTSTAPHHVTTTTQPLHVEPYYSFNPVACTPGQKVVPR